MKSHNKELISIIIPVYNVAPYIEDCLTSIQKQTYGNIEIIVVDDGSEDGSGEICENAAVTDRRMRIIRQKNAGVVVARNRGIEASNGKYIMFVDGDDWIESDMAENLVRQIDGAELVTSGVFYQISPDKFVERYDEFEAGTYMGKAQLSKILKYMLYDKEKELLQRFTPWIYNKLYRTDLVKKIYKEVDQGITFAEDSVFLYKYLLRCQSVIITHQCYYHYRYRAESAMHVVNKYMLIDINRVYLALESDFRNHELGEELLFQLQKWVMVMSCRAMNYHMGFETEVCIPEFIVDISGLKNKKVVLYGAGAAGKCAYIQLKQFGYQVVLWVDKNYKFFQSQGKTVVSPDEILHTAYDVIFLAVAEKRVAEKIIKELLDQGILNGDFVWRKPIRVF